MICYAAVLSERSMLRWK